MPTLLRVATHSLLTAVVQVFPGLGVSTRDVSTVRRSRTRAPCSTCQPWIAVSRSGSNSSPDVAPRDGSERCIGV